MKRLLLLLGLLAALTPRAAGAAPAARHAADAATPTNFAVLPGGQQQGQPVKRIFTYTLARGRSLNDTVMVVNPSRTVPLTVRLSVSDALTLPRGGGMGFADSGTQRRIGRWLQLGSTLVTVPPYHIVTVPLVLRLPSTVSPGEYEGAINATDVQPQAITAAKMQLRYYLNRRCLVLLRVPGHASAGLRVANAGLARRGQQSTLRFTLSDTGTVPAYPTGIVAVISGQGHSYAAHAIAGSILGGDATAVQLAIRGALAPGTYAVRIVVAYAAHLADATDLQQFRTVWSGHVQLR